MRKMNKKQIMLADDIPKREFNHTGYARLLDLENATARHLAKNLVELAETIIKSFLIDDPGTVPEKARERGVYQQMDDRLSKFDEGLRETIRAEMDAVVRSLAEKFSGELQQFIHITSGAARSERVESAARVTDKMDQVLSGLQSLNRRMDEMERSLASVKERGSISAHDRASSVGYFDDQI